jgi:membrane-bound lytic murein transglycosylase MltF
MIVSRLAAVLLASSTLAFAAATVHAQPAAPAAPAAKAPAVRELQVGMRPWTGDLDGMAKRRLVRVLVPYSKTFYYVEKGRPRGVSAEIIEAMEADFNRVLKTPKSLRVKFVALPVGRDELIERLNAGYGDVVVADTTITPARRQQVDFSAPMFKGIREIVVAAPGVTPPATVDDLAGREVFVRRDTSYREHLEALNRELVAAGKPPVKLREAPPELEAEDILEMVDAGLVEMTVVDGYKAAMWKPVYTRMVVLPGVAVSEANDYAFMLRKGSPRFKEALDGFVARHGQGTLFGNTVVNRYAKSKTFAKSVHGSDERRRFGEVVDLFRKYAGRYDVDYLLMVAQGFQESTLDQSKRSPVGAIGIMQIMPATAADLKVGDVHQIENNVHAGVKYMRFMIDRYFADEPMTPLNKGLFAFAAYNCGPGRVASLRKEAAKRGLDPNRWFHHVELVAADRIGPETVTYVSNIYKYYTAYKLVLAQEEERARARESVTPR